jgi:cysteine desulfurase
MQSEGERLLKFRNRLETELAKAIEVTQVNGTASKRLPNITNISFGFVEGESLLMGIKDIACSSGSACTSASTFGLYFSTAALISSKENTCPHGCFIV